MSVALHCHRLRFIALLSTGMLAGTLATSAAALSLSVLVRTSAGAPLEDAVVYLAPARPAPAPLPEAAAQIAQSNKEFVPLVSVIQTGTRVNFPNRDSVRHHVYSFSTPKKFEIKLYSDTPSKPIVFDKPGYVVMGCNIHDSMISHLLIVDTPWFAKTDALGAARIDLPPGDYSLVVWDYKRPDQPLRSMPLTIKADMTQSVTVSARPSE